MSLRDMASGLGKGKMEISFLATHVVTAASVGPGCQIDAERVYVPDTEYLCFSISEQNSISCLR